MFQSAPEQAQDGDATATNFTIFLSAGENGYHQSSLSVVDQESQLRDRFSDPIEQKALMDIVVHTI
jgi:hypothetical protein